MKTEQVDRRGLRARLRTAASPLLEQLERRTLLSVNVLTYHNDLSRTGQNVQETILTTSNVNKNTFGKLFSYPVDGQIYTQPLYVSDLAIPGQGIHNMVFVATEHNSVYAFDADSNGGSNGGVLWHVNLGPSAATPNSDFGNRYGNYHDINPEVGITSTPVIDLASGTIYVDAFTHDGTGLYSHHVHALDITTGTDKVTPTLVAATVSGTGAASSGGKISFVAKQQIQRTALTLVNGVLYVSFAGYADTDPYHGWIIGFNASTLQPLAASVFNVTPNGSEGGIWMGGGGLAADSNGNLFLEVGNGTFGAAQGDYGDTFLKLSTASGLSVADYFTPFNQAMLSQGDRDLGSGAPILLPDQPGAHPHEMIGAGKEGKIYLVDRDNMGQYNSSTDHVVQEIPGAIGGGGSFDTPAYFNGSIYYTGSIDVTKAFALSNGLLSTAPTSQTAVSFGFPGATPSVSASGNTNGILWEIQNSSTAILRAYDATNLSREWYDSSQSGTRDQLGAAVKFAPPTIANGHVYVGTANALAIFGLIEAAPPAAASGLAAVPVSSSQINLSWTGNSNLATAFRILRKTGAAGTYAAISQVPANLTSFSDMGLTPGTDYYYEIVATNAAGDAPASNEAHAATFLRGDVNGDGLVNFSDLVILAAHYGQSKASWAWGDLNGDGSVNFDDLVILAANYGSRVSAAARRIAAHRM